MLCAKKCIKKSLQAGDTIVEVMISTTVVAAVLAGAFLVTSRSTQAVRDSEEHAEALQLLQGQVELLRTAASHSKGLPGDLSSPFCLNASTGAVDSACTVNGRYALSIQSPTATPSPTNTTLFNFKLTWTSVAGANDQVILVYKVKVTP